MPVKEIPYDELEKSFTKPTWWSIECNNKLQLKRIPRKLKKKAKNKNCIFNLPLRNKLWYLQSIHNPNYNRFLIKLICQYYNA